LSRFFTVVFGLTADPIHLGHEQAIINGIGYCRKFDLEIKQFLLMPVYHPNLIVGKNGPVAGFKQRFDMCNIVANRLSEKLNCLIMTSDKEKQCAEISGEKNYSFNTIEFFAKQQNNLQERNNLLFMVSADHFQGRWPKFRKWHKWKELLNHTGLLINQRPGHKINLKFIQKLKRINPEIYIVESEKSVDISSSAIRVANNQFREKNLSKDIFDYIVINNLY